MKLQQLSQALTYAFHLEAIADSIHYSHLTELKNKNKRQQSLTVQYILSEDGRPIIQLFGYHLGLKLAGRTFVQMSRVSKQVLFNEEKLTNYCLTFWPDMAKYQLVIPVLFRILKCQQVVTPRVVDLFAEVCKKQITPFMAQIKQRTPASQLKKFSLRLLQESEKEDLLNTGYIQKNVIQQIYKAQIKSPLPDWPKQLYNPNNVNEINYKMLLGAKYLGAGKNIQAFLLSRFVIKIIRSLKKAAQIIKKKGNKKQSKKKISLPTKPNQKAPKYEKYLKSYIEENKIKKSEENTNRNKFIVKSILEQIIGYAVQIKQSEGQAENKQGKITKSVYVTQPEYPEIEYDEQSIQIKKLKFVGNNDLGFFVAGSRGYLMDNIKSIKKSQIQLNISHAFKESPILQYEVLNNLIYLLKQNGLLYSWAITGDTFLNQIQTSFKKPQSPPNSGICNFLKIKDGVIAVNCTHNLYSRIQLYTLDLNYIGIVELTQLEYGIDYKISQQSKILLKNIRKVALDKKIKQLVDIQALVKQKLHESYLKLSSMVVKFNNGEQFPIRKLEQYLTWVQSFKISNQILLPSLIFNKLKSQTGDRELMQYLLRLGYINEAKVEDVQKFVNQSNIKSVENRKKQLLTLFEDNSLQSVTSPFLTKEQFIVWVRPACLMDLQLKQLLETIQYRPDGKVDMSKLYYNEHYRRINDSKYGRFNPHNYKCEQTPPICIKQFVHLPAFQIMVFSTCFPLHPKIYVANMINGNLLSSYDLSTWTSIPPSIRTCDKNGYIFVIAGRTISLWNSLTLSQSKQPTPVKNWINLQSSTIIDLGIIYQQQTLITLTKDTIKIWDFNQLCKKRESYNIFKIKPGYRAIENTGTGAKNYKKKILLRENAKSLFHFVSANQSIVAGAVSCTNNNKWYVKSFAINKFNVVINAQKQYYQIPTKLLRELQIIALKRKNLPPVTKSISTNQCQKAMQNRIAEFFKQKLRAATEVKMSAQVKPELQRKIFLLSNTLSSIYNRSMFKDNEPSNRLQNIFKIITMESMDKLGEILENKFMQLYRYQINNQKKYNIDEMLQDCMSTKQKKIVNRVLYVMSLIEKYTRSVVNIGSKIGKLISEDRVNLSQHLILSILPKGTPPDSRVVAKVVKTMNNLPSPLGLVIKIIENNLPTRYRFLVPRYIKQIVSGKQSPELNQYISNRYEYEPQVQQILDNIMNNSFDGIQIFIQQNDLLKFVKEQVVPSFPLALNCNYSLIEALMCLKIITENQAFYYCVQQSNRPEERLSSKIVHTGQVQEQKLDQIIERINKKIVQNKLVLPEPKLSFQYFKKQLYSEQNYKNFFFGFLNGDRNQQQIFTEKLQICLKSCNRKIRLKYRLSQWQWIMNEKILPLKPLVNQILQRFPIDFRIVSVVDLKTALMSMIQQQSIYEDLVKRICFSCTSSEQKLSQWVNSEGSNVQTEGMWVNINHLLRYTEDYNPSLLEIQNIQKVQKQISIKIPAYSLIEKLNGDSLLLPISKFRKIMTLNLIALSLSQMNGIVSKFYKYNMKKISIFQIKELMPKDLTIVGRILIDKYHRLQFQNRFTVVNDMINSIQIIQLFGSKLLTLYLFGDQQKGLPEFIPFEKVATAIKQHLVQPAAKKMSISLALSMPNQIIELLQQKGKKSSSLPVLNVTQLINSNNYDQTVVSSLLKFMASQSDSAQLISLTSLIDYIKKTRSDFTEDAYQVYTRKLIQKTKNRNLIDLFLQQCQPQNYPFVQQDSPKSYIFTHDHLKQIIGEQCEWYINSRPFAKITEFIDHITWQRKQKQLLQKTILFFTQNCIYKVGINQIIKLLGVNPTFVQFYQKLKSFFKILAKMETRTLILLYHEIIKFSENGKCDQNGLKNLSQFHISVNKKTQWISALYDKQLIINPLEQEQATLDCELKIQKLKNLMYEQTGEKGLQKLKKSLNYSIYLLHKYLSNDTSKIRQVYLSIQDKKLQDAKNMLQIYGVTNQLHVKQLIQYISTQFKDHEQKKPFGTDQFSVDELRNIINLIKANPSVANQQINPEQEQEKNKFKFRIVKESKIYEQFKRNGGISEYYCTYHSFLLFCQSLLISKITNNSKITEAQNKIRDFLIRKDLTVYKLYELLDLSSYENIMKYLPYCAMEGTQSEEQISDMIKVITELAKPDRNNIKYPINSFDFHNMLVNKNSKTGKERKQYQFLYNQLDWLGIGYANLNDLIKYRGKYPAFLSPYVFIPDYIDYISNKENAGVSAFPSLYAGPILPPPQNKQLRNKIKQKLLKYQLPVRNSQKTKLIKVDICFAVLGQFGIAQDHQYRQFIKQKFTMRSNGLLDLSGVVDWLLQSLIQEKQQYSNQKIQQKFAEVLGDLGEKLEIAGGIYAYANKIYEQQKQEDLQKLFNSLIELQISEFRKQIEKMSQKALKVQQKIQILVKILKELTEKYFKEVKKWDTFNNHFYKQVKNMAQNYYTLVYKFYRVHSGVDMHQIYQNISENGFLTLISLWEYIEKKGITGYSRADINQLFNAIDLNSDKQLSYFQFCQFWMACQQIFQTMDDAQYQFNTEIDKINNEVKDRFLQLCSIDLDTSYEEVLAIDDIVRFTNIPNVQKVDYIARAVNNSLVSRAPRSGAFDCKIELRKSKLKIMMEKMKKNQANQVQNSRVNLFILATQPDIYHYIKQGYNSQNLSKIIVAKYPKIGYQIVQHFHDLCKMEIKKLQQKYQETQDINVPALKSINSRQQRLNSMSNLISHIEQSYRKNPFKIKSYEHKQCGASIASGLLGEQIRKSINNIAKQVKQMENFIKKFEEPNVPLYYQLQQQEEYSFGGGTKIKSLTAADLAKYEHETVINEVNKPLFSIKQKIYSHKPFKLSSVIDEKSDDVIWRQIIWKDTDFVCKSQSKVNILQYADLYSDPEISLIPINVDNSSRFRIEGSYLYRPEYQAVIEMVPDIDEQQKERDHLIDRVMSLIKIVTDKLIYCYYKYSMTGLLLIPQNLLINVQNNQDIKFNNFLSVILLNQAAIKNKEQTVNYVDGIDSQVLINDKRPYPPQAKLPIHTEAMDVFMLIHIVYGIYRQFLNPSDMLIPSISPIATEQETLWDWSSPLHQISSKILNSRSQNELSQKEYNLWVLFYECSAHDWYMRPRLYQLQQVADNYFSSVDTNIIKNLFAINDKIQEAMICLNERKIGDALEKLAFIPKDHWRLDDIIKFREVLQNIDKIDTAILQYYNSIIQMYLKCDHAQTEPQKMRLFMSNIVNYLLMIPPTNSGQCFIGNATFKNILNEEKAKRYLGWCDENWKINQYQINKKIQKINMEQKLDVLHKNSSFYHDIATLAQCRVTLADNETAKRNDTSKKVAISFIHSCLVSNNINKIYAVYRSQILKNIYSFVGREELQGLVISIFQITTSCFNPTLKVNRYRAVDEVYKVMMVISNSINGPTNRQSSQKKTTNLKSSKLISSKVIPQSKVIETESVVSMKDFVNNYYTITGQQCKQIVLVKICKQQLCILPVLTYIMNEVDITKLNKIIVNISYDQQVQKILRSPVVGGYYNRLKQAKLDPLIKQIKQATSLHTESVCLANLSTTPLQQQNYLQLAQYHIKYYKWYTQQLKRRGQQKPIQVNYQRNFHNHFQSFIAKSQRLFQVEVNYVQINQISKQNVCIIIKLHLVMFDVWTKLPSHPDFTAATLRFLIKALELIQNDNDIYTKSQVNSETTPDILQMLQRFWMEDASPSAHDLSKIALDNGFIQFYCRTVRRQYELMQIYIEKNVENIHLTDNYHPQAQFRIICFYLFLENKRFATEICQMMIANQFPSFIVENMLHSSLILDLRFYKANDELVPFRYCNPLRSEAITMIGFVLSNANCLISDEISSRLIPWLPSQIRNIINYSLQTVPEKMKWVQSLWLLANITNSQNERLKYEFINLRLHEILSAQIEKFPFLNRFFPEMTQTLRNSQIMVNSLARSQLIR